MFSDALPVKNAGRTWVLPKAGFTVASKLSLFRRALRMSNDEMIIQLRLYVTGIRHADCLEAKAQRYGQALGYIKAMEDAGLVFGEELAALRSEIETNRLRSELP